MSLRVGRIFLVVVALLQVVALRGQTVITVNTAADMVDADLTDGRCDADLTAGGEQCTLRAAIQEANLHGGSIIQFESALDGTPLVLSIANIDECPPDGCVDENQNATGDLDIGPSLTITGNGKGKTIIQGGSSLATAIDRVFDIDPLGEFAESSYSFSGVTIQYGSAPFHGGGGIRIGFRAGTVTIADSEIKDNRADDGGAIRHEHGLLFIDNVTISGNTAEDGGGIHSWTEGQVSITDSTFSNNVAFSPDEDPAFPRAEGGALFIGSSVFNPETSLRAGSTITNSTLSGNRASVGCAAAVPASVLHLDSVTVKDNCAAGSSAAALETTLGEVSGDITLRNTVIDNPPGITNCRDDGLGDITSEDYNLSSDESCELFELNDVQNTPALLGPLVDNGGPTWTHLPLPGSPAIDTGTTTHCPPLDQRGATRPSDGDGDTAALCDRGAVEVLGVVGPPPSTGTIAGVKWNDVNNDRVQQPDEAGVPGVQICVFPTTPLMCVATGAAGEYQFSGLVPGTYHVYEKLPPLRVNTTARYRQVDVFAAGTVIVNFGNRVPDTLDPVIDVNTDWRTAGIPVQPRGQAFIVRVTPTCVASSVTATFVDDLMSRTQPMTKTAANTFEARFEPPFSGAGGRLSVDVTCDDATTEQYSSETLFIDPSGTILDACTGGPLEGATVTLTKNEPYGSATFIVPDSAEHIPSNNPEITQANGLYAWDVVPGRWRVTATKAGYTTFTTNAFDVPPPVLGLDITLRPIAGCPVPNAPPEITRVTPSLGSLWPPNHKLVPIAVTVDVTDDTSTPTCTIASVSSNEPDNGLGDGDTADDIQRVSGLTLQLRSERAGGGSGRTYTINVTCRDDAGGTASASTTVSVARSMKK